MTYRREVPILLLAVLTLLAAAKTPALAQAPPPTFPPFLQTLPGLSSAQDSVAKAIDILCPNLVKLESARQLNAVQQDLLDQCRFMRNGSLGRSVLPDVLRAVTSEQTAAQGTGAIETSSPQLRLVGPRLSALRLGTTGIALNGLKLDFDGMTVAADQSPGAERRGGGASADTNLAGRLGGFVNGVGGFGSKDTTANEVGFDFHNVGVTAGADYRFTDNLAAGLAFSYLRTNADFNAALGDVDTNSYGISLYGTYYVGPFYVDLLGGFTWHNYDTTRRIVYSPGTDAPSSTRALPVNRTATSDTDGRQFTINVGAGYDFRLGATTLTPYTRVEYLNLDIDGYTERGAGGLNLKIRDQDAESLLTVLGGRVAHAIGTRFAVLVPQVRGEWRHEFLNNQRSINAQYANDPLDTLFTIPTENPDRNYFAVGASISAIFQRGVAAFLDFETILGLRDVTNHNFTAGVRIQF